MGNTFRRRDLLTAGMLEAGHHVNSAYQDDGDPAYESFVVDS